MSGETRNVPEMFQYKKKNPGIQQALQLYCMEVAWEKTWLYTLYEKIEDRI